LLLLSLLLLLLIFKIKKGGTFAINKKSIVYVYEDGVPGDHPSPIDVIASFEK